MQVKVELPTKQLESWFKLYDVETVDADSFDAITPDELAKAEIELGCSDVELGHQEA